MSDPTDFLLARIAEDEEMARRVIIDGDADQVGRWEWVEYPYEGGSPQPLGALAESSSGYGPDWSWTLLVNRHDPARVLAECEAKRRIVELHGIGHECSDDGTAAGWAPAGWYGEAEMECPTLRHLAAIYAAHPNYDASWRP